MKKILPTPQKLDLKTSIAITSENNSPSKSSVRFSNQKSSVSPRTQLKNTVNTSEYFSKTAIKKERIDSNLNSPKGIMYTDSGPTSFRDYSSPRSTLPKNLNPIQSPRVKGIMIPGFTKASLSPKAFYENEVNSAQSSRMFMTQTNRESTVLTEGDQGTNPYFSKFNNYFQALNRSEVRKSPLAKELFYYPDQIELNRKLAEQQKKIKQLEDKDLFQLRTIKEGKKEKIELPIGSKCYLKISCASKTFPLKVKIESKLGTYQVCVSKSVEKPDRQNCDYCFSSSYFEVHYATAKDIPYLYFNITGSGNLQMVITMNFAVSPEKKSSNLIKKMNGIKKPSISSDRYEFFHQNMTWQEESDFVAVIDQIRKERFKKLYKSNKHIVAENMNLATEYSNIKKEHFAKLIQKRNEFQDKNKEKRANIMHEAKLKQICNLLRPEVRKIEKAWKQEKEEEAQKAMMIKKNWIIIMSLYVIGNDILEKKKNIIAWRVIMRLRERAARKIQRQIREYLARPISIQNQEKPTDRVKKTLNRKQAIIAINVLNALTVATLQSHAVHIQAAERFTHSFCADIVETGGFIEAINKYSVKALCVVMKIQKKWRERAQMMDARIHLFHIYWSQYCLAILEEGKKKNKILELIPKIKERHIHKYAKTFVKNRMDVTEFVIQALQSLVAQRQPQANDMSENQSGDNQDSMTFIPNEVVKMQSKNNMSYQLKFKPSKEELKQIFGTIIKEVMREEEGSLSP